MLLYKEKMSKEYYYCMYCKGIWEGSFDGNYIGLEKEVEYMLGNQTSTAGVCNSPYCQNKLREYIEESDKLPRIKNVRRTKRN